MARFTLVVRPDGKALLTCQEPLSEAMAAELRSAVDEWDDDDTPLLVIPECDVVQVVDIEIDLDDRSSGRSSSAPVQGSASPMPGASA